MAAEDNDVWAERDVWAELDRVLSSESEQILPRSAGLARSIDVPIHSNKEDKRKTKLAEASTESYEQPQCKQTWKANSSAAAKRKTTRQFLIMDLDEAAGHEASPLHSHTSDHLADEAADASEVALSRCATASVSPRQRRRAFSVQDFDSVCTAKPESVCKSLSKLSLNHEGGGLALICGTDCLAQDSESANASSLANWCHARHKEAISPQQWAADVDPDLLSLRELRSAIALLQERVRQLEIPRSPILKSGPR
jgi:hypothetical protein